MYRIDSIYVDPQFTIADSIPLTVKGNIISYEYRTTLTSVNVVQDSVFIYIEFEYGFPSISFDWSVNCRIDPLPVGKYVVTATAQVQGPPYYRFYKFNSFQVVDPNSVNNETWTNVNNSIQNFPNPAKNSTIIKSNIQLEGYYELRIYNTFGIEVKNINNLFFRKGENIIQVDISDLSDGIYVYSMQSKEYNLSNKMIIKK